MTLVLQLTSHICERAHDDPFSMLALLSIQVSARFYLIALG